MNLAKFLDILKVAGLEFFQKYYAIYPGVVEDNKDPDKMGRVKISMPTILGPNKPLAQWAMPMGRDLAGKDTGCFFPPYIGDVVDVMFENGNINVPRYMGGFWAMNELPADFLEGYPNVKGWVFKSKQKITIDESPGKLKISIVNGDQGAFVVLDDTDGSEGIYIQHKSGSLVQIDKDGSLILATKNGNLLFQNDKDKETTIVAPDGTFMKLGNKGIIISDSTGANFLNINDKTVEINAKDLILTAQNINNNAANVGIGKNAVFSAVLGEPLITWLSAHVHNVITPIPGTPVSPPTVPPPVPLILSTAVKIKSNIP